MKTSRKQAFTLVELLTVITIIAILLSLGIYTMVSLGRTKRLEATAGTLRSMIRSARNTARQDKGFGILYLSTKNRVVKVAASKVVAYFHFEENQVQEGGGKFTIRGGGEADMIGEGRGIKLEKGHLGKGILFSTKESVIKFPSNPLISPNFGIEIDTWVYVEDPSLQKSPNKDGTPPPKKPTTGEFYVVQKDQAYLIRLSRDRRVEVGLRGEDEKGGVVNHFVQTYPDIFPYSEWFHLQMNFYRGDLKVMIDGIPRKLKPIKMADNASNCPVTLNVSPDSLLVGGGDFPAILDQFRIQAVVESENIQLPGSYDIVVEGGVPFFSGETLLDYSPKKDSEHLYYKIYFDEKGELDSRYHSGPVRITLGILDKTQPASPPAKASTSEKKNSSAPPPLKWKQVLYIGIDPSGGLLSEERSKNLAPGQALKIKEDDRKVK